MGKVGQHLHRPDLRAEEIVLFKAETTPPPAREIVFLLA
jgi:hypothetical protein